eukprot:gb/GECH01006345.1/.p1 GENE.gb/GECH01006345.1/~~gb/GECH01006345.1/.p1  ORF type:complete len:284 (+),score=65.52 gb/GECH01006345.1/:1-852(+)
MKTWKIPNCNLTLSGVSQAGEETCFMIPETKWLLDAGAKFPNYKPRHLFLTHTHTDHSFMLPFYYHREQTAQIYAPSPATPYLERFIRTSQYLNDMPSEYEKTQLPKYEMHSVNSGQSFRLPDRKHSYHVEIVPCHHTVDTVGYGFSLVKKRLREEYKSYSGKGIGQIRKNGVDVTELVTEPQFLFMGDSSIEVLENSSSRCRIEKYPVVIMECTILDNRVISPDQCRERGHIHWEQLKPYIQNNTDIVFVLIHISSRYSSSDIKQFFDNVKENEGIKNIVPW